MTRLAIQRWSFAIVNDAIFWVVYDDITREIERFEIENPSIKDVRLIVTEVGGEPVTWDHPSRAPTKSFDVAGIGRVVDGNDEGELDLPPGLVVMFQTLPTVTAIRSRRRA